jgi:hypothetical protein
MAGLAEPEAMSGATIQHNFEHHATIPPWPEQRARAVQSPPKARRADTRRLLTVPSVSTEVVALYDACLVNDVSWWNCGVLALMRTLLTMGYSTLAEASADGKVYKEIAQPRLDEIEKHIIKPYNLTQYFVQVSHLARPVDHLPLHLLVAELQAVCEGQVLRGAGLVLEHTVPYLETAAQGRGALAGHAADVKRLRAELVAIVAKLKKAKRASEAMADAAS